MTPVSINISYLALNSTTNPQTSADFAKKRLGIQSKLLEELNFAEKSP